MITAKKNSDGSMTVKLDGVEKTYPNQREAWDAIKEYEKKRENKDAHKENQ